jgi:hypothetical protein
MIDEVFIKCEQAINSTVAQMGTLVMWSTVNVCQKIQLNGSQNKRHFVTSKVFLNDISLEYLFSFE